MVQPPFALSELPTNPTNEQFEDFALKLFFYQAQHNLVYKNYLSHIKIEVNQVSSLLEIPFLPISFFKSHAVKVLGIKPQLTFESSGTTGQITSKHHVASKSLYVESFTRSWNSFYPNPSSTAILGLLPSYLERENSSLVFMVNHLIQNSKRKESGFFLNNHQHLAKTIESLEKNKVPYLLIGVTFALLDFAEQYNLQLSYGVVMETGGMKGRRKEMVREEVHSILTEKFGVKTIHSEYGMTELLSQAYSKGLGLFEPGFSMKVLPRDTNDPFSTNLHGAGGLNIIDLANIYSCGFIATQDLGSVNVDGTFKVLGRFDQAEVRGCNLMAV